MPPERATAASPLAVVVEADGGSRGNPGPAGYGALVREAASGEVLQEDAAGIGRATNNVAEYRGAISGLRMAAALGATDVEVRMDSKLVVEQMSGRWQVKHPDMLPLAREAAALAAALPRVRWQWVPRAKNAAADALANAAMDLAASGRSWSPSIDGGRISAAYDAEPRDPPAGPSARERASHPDDSSTEPPAARPSAPPAAPASSGPRRGSALPTGTPTRLFLVRHGQTAHSAARLFSGTSDPPLTDLGRSQAAAAVPVLTRLVGEGPALSGVVASPLQRTQQTARVLADALGLPVSTDSDLRETDFGDWEGLAFGDIQRRWPDQLQAWLADPTGETPPPGGESFAATAERVAAARDRITAENAERAVVVVSHTTPIKCLVQLGLQAPVSALFRLHVDLASVSTLDVYADGPASLRGWNALA